MIHLNIFKNKNIKGRQIIRIADRLYYYLLTEFVEIKQMKYTFQITSNYKTVMRTFYIQQMSVRISFLIRIRYEIRIPESCGCI